ncbi:CAP domain-containing protein [Secundilactobacillus mixtipabuli]|uniref:SCP domain-containing protein n=1 Tax=Secundilactobacillus mixtipabuli TaxID=1435342 RepID=A0A1Z5I9R6_9LACO|nr:CAP domain-containing protein [Secundilactobacillus mixtipabuli]GAW98532.1 hypothetical protein IWT30_00477 [Secundilactobacillus mixtipabuli]
MRKSLIKTLAVTTLSAAAFVGAAAFNTPNASAKTTIRSYQNIKNATYTVTNKHATVYKTGSLAKKTGTMQNYGSKVTGYYAVHVTRNGKASIYYKFRVGKKTGWVWHGYLKKATAVKPASNTQPAAGSTTTTDNSSSNSSKSDKYDFSVSGYRADFLKAVNAERAKRGIAPLKEDADLDQMAQIRAGQTTTTHSHYDSDGSVAVDKLSKSMGIPWGAEVIATDTLGKDFGTTNNEDVTKADIEGYIYEDAGSNWGHRDALLNPSFTKIGMGFAQEGGPDAGWSNWASDTVADLD